MSNGTGDELPDLLSMPGDDDASIRLHERLIDAARAEGLLDVAYRTVDSPLGQLLLAGTEVGLVRVAYALEDHERVLSSLAETISPRVLHAPGRLDPAAAQLDEYFARRRSDFDLPLDRRLSHGFRGEVLAYLSEIGYGHTASYGDVAAALGRPKAARAVGSACARNPLPVVVPCHRVVLSDGSTGEYAGGAEAKNALLSLEAG